MLNTGISLQRLATKAGVGFTPKKLFSNGEAGVWYDPSDVEASLTWRRNLLEYTESFDNSYWQGYFGKPSLTTGQADPLGGNNAMKWNASTTTGGGTGDRGGFYRDDFDGIMKQNTDYTVSVWLKASTSVTLLLSLNDGPSTSLSVTTEWQRFSVTTQLSSNPAHGARVFQIVDATNADVDIYIFGAQTEEGSTATEYQPIRSTFDNAFKQAFPKHTLYQDHTGGAPVTATGQPVRAMLDKSQGVTLEEQTHTATAGSATYDSNTNTVTFARNGTYGSINYTASVGDVFRVSGTYTTNESVLRLGDNDGVSYPIIADFIEGTNDFVGIIKVHNNTNLQIYVQQYSAGTPAFSISNFKVEKILGSHATQLDSTKAPVFARHPERGRVNLFKYTEELDNSYYDHLNGLTVTPNAGVAPDGSQTADRLNFANNNLSRLEKAFPNGQANTPVVYSVWMRTESGSVTLDLGHQGTGKTNVTVTTEWQRFTHTFTDTDGSFYPRVQNNEAVTKSVLSWGWQIEYANEATGYQKVVDDYDITESGYKSVYYLQFDGINDTMAVQPVTSTNAPISVFMGHDTEGNSSTSGYFLDIQDGRFLLAGAGYYSTASNWQNGTNIDATAKGVSTVVSDGTNANYRRDGIVEHTGALANVSIQGAISIFSRHDYTTQHTNGNMYQLVIRGATSTDKEIDQAEEFVAIKTGLKSEVVGLATLDLNFGANTYTARNSNGSVL